jgi:hypothetical protein
LRFVIVRRGGRTNYTPIKPAACGLAVSFR